MKELSEIILDDYFAKAETYTVEAVDMVFGFTKMVLAFWFWFLGGANEQNDVEIKQEKDIRRELREKQVEFKIYLKEGETLAFDPARVKVWLPPEKINRFNLQIRTPGKPLIGTGVDLILESGGETLYWAPGSLIREKVVQPGREYEMMIQVNFDTLPKVAGAKGILSYLKEKEKERTA
jgi:hypothetical protein